MKLPDVDYIRPKTLKEALDLLSAHGDDAKLIAGGQSLMPMLAFRLLAPKILIDLAGLSELRGIEITESGVRLGARTTWHDIERHPSLKSAHPLLAAAIGHVAHYQIRNRGTAGGSLAHCDPVAEFPTLVVTCGAEVVVAGQDGERVIPAADFVLGPMTTALAADEIIVQIRFPAWPQARRWGFEEFARRRGDFAMAAAAVFYDLDGDQRALDPHVGIIGDADGARRLTDVEDLLAGQRITRSLLTEARALAERSTTPSEDIHAPAPYRRALIGTMVERALAASAGISLSKAVA
ncbi:xanthine dehydrogenase family protein subunit M [Pseudolabrys taiwanensis]|uniref:Xanthine dehydrogenase family protein subunit M n=1 Tax=Pseudolabrys taiwanensis TaxID=331696 RepID=A0A345ZVI9_9HYPH|nr:xanthine dehydrogenase family protein subunit M [Pseudolabrys taiwanensis]AXK80936.1 xanthine dehydrogenase family protein subunit M [Pseudolabrys taiwanensis]